MKSFLTQVIKNGTPGVNNYSPWVSAKGYKKAVAICQASTLSPHTVYGTSQLDSTGKPTGGVELGSVVPPNVGPTYIFINTLCYDYVRILIQNADPGGSIDGWIFLQDEN